MRKIGKQRAGGQQDRGTSKHVDFFISDNGAPLREGAYVGSFNEPMVGEKGMQTDGGQRVPFITAWLETIPDEQIFEETIWSQDAVATIFAVAGARRPHPSAAAAGRGPGRDLSPVG